MSKSFFLPNDLFPPTGPNPPIQLGQLIENIKDPGMKLADRKPLDFTGYDMTVSDMPVSVVRNFDESGQQSHLETGILFNALQFLLVKFNVKYAKTDFENMLHDIDQLHTLTIFPTDDYVKASLLQPEVQHCLRKGWFQQSVYMVTGIKVATKGASMKTESGQSQETAVGGEAGGGSHGVSGSASVQHGSQTYRVQGTSFVADADFVYAFQVRKCHFGSNRVKKPLFTKNALLSGGPLESVKVHDEVKMEGHEQGQDEDNEEEVLEFDYYELDEEDATMEDIDDSTGYETVSFKDKTTSDATLCIGLK
jgi:hypothetical protein